MCIKDATLLHFPLHRHTEGYKKPLVQKKITYTMQTKNKSPLDRFFRADEMYNLLCFTP